MLIVEERNGMVNLRSRVLKNLVPMRLLSLTKGQFFKVQFCPYQLVSYQKFMYPSKTSLLGRLEK